MMRSSTAPLTAGALHERLSCAEPPLPALPSTLSYAECVWDGGEGQCAPRSARASVAVCDCMLLERAQMVSYSLQIGA